MKILAADDHALIRAGLRTILQDLGEEITFVEAWDGSSARSMLKAHADVDLMLLDVKLPDCDGLSLLQELLGAYPALPIVMLSAESDSETVSRAIDFGAAGFLPKTSLNLVLVPALRLVLAGGIYVPREALRQEVAAPIRKPLLPSDVQPAPAVANTPPAPTATPATLGLTDRQNEVLVLLLQGKSNKQICRELDLAEATVKVHVRAILRALDVNSRTEAVVAYSKLGVRAGEAVIRQPEPLSRSKHANLRFNPLHDYRHARNMALIPLTAEEIGDASQSLPIVFASNGKTQPLALLGVSGINAFVNEEGGWTAGAYIPAMIRTYPFALARTNKGNEFAVVIDRSAPHFNTESGDLLFDASGTPGSVITQAKNFLGEIKHAAERTEALCQVLQDSGVMTEVQIKLTNDTPAGLPTVQIVDQKKFVALSNETRETWAKNGLLTVVNAHLNSLSNIRIFKNAVALNEGAAEPETTY